MFIMFARMEISFPVEMMLSYLLVCWKEVRNSEIRLCGSAMQFNFPDCFQLPVMSDKSVCI